MSHKCTKKYAQKSKLDTPESEKKLGHKFQNKSSVLSLYA